MRDDEKRKVQDDQKAKNILTYGLSLEEDAGFQEKDYALEDDIKAKELEQSK